MAKKQSFTDEDNELLDALGVEVETKIKSSRTPKEERIIAGFEDIELFFEQYGRLPTHGEEKDIFERLYAVRLDKIRSSEECRTVLAGIDKHGLFAGAPVVQKDSLDDLDDDALLSELGVTAYGKDDITTLKHVRPRAEIKAADTAPDVMPTMRENSVLVTMLRAPISNV